jgi:hypothetical protein
MRKTLLVLMLAGMMCPPASAQSVANVCHTMSRADRIDPVAHKRGVDLRDTLITLLNRTPVSAERQAALDDFWRTDSLNLAWHLGGLVAQSTAVSDEVAANAAEVLRRHPVDAAFVLAPMAVLGAPRRRALALSTLMPPLTPQAEEVVFHYACDAAWQLAAIQRDSEYYPAAGSDPHDHTNVRGLASILRMARDLSRGTRRHQIDSLASLVHAPVTD